MARRWVQQGALQLGAARQVLRARRLAVLEEVPRVRVLQLGAAVMEAVAMAAAVRAVEAALAA